MSIAKPFTFVANTYAKASEVNANFDTVYSQVNSNISAISQNAVDIENLENNKANINGSADKRFGVADAVTASDAINKQSLTKAIGNSLNYIDGYTITKDSGNPNNTIIVSAGSCYDSSKTVVLNKANSSTKTNDSQTKEATYYVYVIGSTTGSSVDILISESSVKPGLPSGYTLYRQIGYYTTDSNNNINLIYSYSNSKVFNTNDIMPDYSTTSSYSRNTEYAVDMPGYLFVRNTASTDDYHINVYIKYNGVTRTFRSQSSSEDTDYTYDTMTFPLPVGATFKAGVYDDDGNSKNVGLNIWFFKCIGV